MVICQICNKQFKNNGSLGNHISRTHNITAEQYYLNYVNPYENTKCPYCGKYKKFVNTIVGFSKTCGSKECKSKQVKNTMLEAYGVDVPSKSKNVINKIKKTCIERYGVYHYSKTSEFKEKYKNKMIVKYGVDNYSKTNKFKDSSHINNINKFINRVKFHRPDLELLKFTENYYYTKYICRWKCLKCGTDFEDYAASTDSWLHPRCPTCNPISYSSIENKVYNHLVEILDECNIHRCTKEIITPYELDLYIPSLNLAIECDGDYWHSDEVLINHYGLDNKEYCELKESLCIEKNIKLLRFTETDINNNFNEVKNKIRSVIYESKNNNPCR